MNPSRQALGLGHPLQERDQLRTLRGVEGAQQLSLVFVGKAFQLGQELSAPRSQVEPVGAAICRVAAPLGEAALLEVVDECDHGAAVDPQRGAQCLLGLALVYGELAEHPEVPRMEVKTGEALGEAPMPMGAQLHQEEARTAAQAARRGCLLARAFYGHAADRTGEKLFMI